MSFTRQATKTVTLSSVGTYTTNLSTHLDGLIQAVYIKPSTDLDAGGTVTLTRATSTNDTLLIATNTTKNGAWYYPHALAQGTTENTLASSAPVQIPLHNEQVRVAVATSSGKASETVQVLVTVV
jgi:hypothetical protein